MNNYTVTVTGKGYVVGVHYNIRAESGAAACEIARGFYPPSRHGLKFRAAESASC